METTTYLSRLGDTAAKGGADAAHATLAELARVFATDLVGIERAIDALPRDETPLHRTFHHLLSAGGKRLRPLCVLLSGRLSGGVTDATREVAFAVELVHNATLLHDDVVDVGDTRRGKPSARTLYGNAASIFAGDWLLVDALRRLSRATDPATVDAMLGVLREMLDAEALQLEKRGTLALSTELYLSIVKGKTASLFRWGLASGARVSGASEEVAAALGRFGEEFGIAFQVVDDLLDVAGDPALVGKDALADLNEGKATLPLLLAVKESPAVRELVTAALAGGTTPEVARALAEAIVRAGGVDGARRFARERTDRALAELASLPASETRSLLETTVHALLGRAL